VDSWILKPELSGGAAVDLHIHDLDYVNWLLGELKLFFAQGVRSPPEFLGPHGYCGELWWSDSSH